MVHSSLEKPILYFLPNVRREISCYQKGFSSDLLAVLTKKQQNHRDSATLRTMVTAEEKQLN